MDTAFHDVIYKASRNKRCMNIISTLRQQITSIRERSMPYPGRLDEMLLEHRAIVDAIAQRDVEKARWPSRPIWKMRNEPCSASLKNSTWYQPRNTNHKKT